MALITCPECNARISSKAAACPRCGLPMKGGENAPRPWKKDLEEVRRVGFWVFILISLPTLTLPALIGKVIAPGMLGQSEVQSLWDVLVLTVPLTSAVAIFGVLLLRDKVDSGAHYFFLLVLVGTTLLSSWVGLDSNISLSDIWEQSTNLNVFLLRLLIQYWAAYQTWNFFSSLVVGGFLAWIWAKKILPRIF